MESVAAPGIGHGTGAHDRDTAQLSALLIVAVAVGFFLNLGGAPLFDVDEGAFSEATREMFVRGDFISPYLNGAPRFDKPILIYWLQAASVWLLGVSEIALRLPSALAATAWTAAIFAFVDRVLDRRTALIAAITAATALGVTVIGKAATADALLNALLCAAMLDIYRYYLDRRRGQILRVFLWMGLGMLTKGPIAVLIPFAVSLVLFGWAGEWRTWLRAVLDPAGLLILAGIALPWYAVQYSRGGYPFIADFFLKHNVGRFSGPMQGHSGSLLYYIPVALGIVLPYTSLLLAALTRIRSALHDDLDRYLWLWLGFVLVFFSLSGTKLPHYLLYGATPLFILMARYRDMLRSRTWAFLPPIAWLTLLALLPWVAGMMHERTHDPYLKDLLGSADHAFGGAYELLLALAIVATLAIAWIPCLAVWRKLLLAGLVSSAVLSLLVLPALGRLLQGPVVEAAQVARARSEPVVMWNLNAPSFSVYSRRVTPGRRPAPGELVLTKVQHLPELGAHEILYRRGGIALARMLAGG